MYTMKPTKPVILTGVRANNNIHIGNYFGAILPIINMTKRRPDEYDINLFIPDFTVLRRQLTTASYTTAP